MEIMDKQLKNFNIGYERVSAIDGNELGDPKNPNNFHHLYWNKYAHGLVKTFKQILRRAKRNKYKKIIIFEDDVILDDNFHMLFNYYFMNLPEKWDIVQFSGGNHRDKLKYVNPNLFRTKQTMGTYAMLINIETSFDKILNATIQEINPLDDMLTKIQSGGNCYMFYPGLVIPRDNVSDITGQETQYSKQFHYHKHPYLEQIIAFAQKLEMYNQMKQFEQQEIKQTTQETVNVEVLEDSTTQKKKSRKRKKKKKKKKKDQTKFYDIQTK